MDSNGAALLEGLADQIVVALDAVRLRRNAAEAEILGCANELRNSILQAVSHDLRTPLTGIKASVTSLLSSEVSFDREDTNQLLSTIDDEVDRLDRVVGNLLDMSRLQSGVLPLQIESTPVEEIVGSALSSLDLTPDRFRISISRDLPSVLVDVALVERAVANIIANAEVQTATKLVEIGASYSSGATVVALQIVDHGPGIDIDEWDRALAPFQRLGDSSSQTGVGLGMAIANGAAGIAHARSDPPDVILVDLGLPDLDGVHVIERIRSFSEAPIIVLSVRGDETDKVGALDAGADDYVTKPFGMDELLARMRAALRRQGPSSEVESVVRTAHFELNLNSKQARVGGVEVRLTPIEWGLCEELVGQPGRLVPRRRLLQAVWGPEYGTESNYLRVHLANLRHKLEPDPAAPIYFITEPGIGYRFQTDGSN